MNKFIKELFVKDGQYLLYGADRKFVARFKHRGPFTMSKFRKELIASHTPLSYFTALKGGIAPLTILKDANPRWYSNIINRFKLGVL